MQAKYKRFFTALKAFLTHASVSALIVALVTFLVLKIWFPHPYADLLGSLDLLWMVIGVDMVCGPLLTAIVYNSAKQKHELTMDLSLIAIVQLVALGYGLYTITAIRPVIQAFEVDRMVVVTANEIDTTQLTQAPKGLQKLSWTGARVVGTRQPKNTEEKLQSLELSVGGLEPSARPNWWQAYAKNKSQIQQRMEPLADLRVKQNPSKQQAIDAAVKETGLALEALFYLPLTSEKNKDSYIVLLNRKTDIVGYAPVGGFD